MHNLYIDNDAKLRVSLNKGTDKSDQPFYMGKLQFPGDIDFESGVSFMIFVSEEGYEELQIGPIDPRKRRKSRREGIPSKNGRIVVDLHPFTDKQNETAYVGEMQAPAKTNLREGIFFTIFLSKEGAEQLQISRLDKKPRRKRNEEFDSNSSHDIPEYDRASGED